MNKETVKAAQRLLLFDKQVKLVGVLYELNENVKKNGMNEDAEDIAVELLEDLRHLCDVIIEKPSNG